MVFLIFVADEAWMRFKDNINRKRGKKCWVSCKVSPSGELIIQRLSSVVSGKVQKHRRVDPREFVGFEYDELSIENSKGAPSTYGYLMINNSVLGFIQEAWINSVCITSLTFSQFEVSS